MPPIPAGGDGDLLAGSRLVREARALCEVALQVNESLVPDRVFELVVRHAATLLGARAARLVLLDDSMIEVRAAYGGSLAGVGTRVPVATSLSGEAIRTCRPVRTTDIRAEVSRWPSAILPLEGARANGIAVPLVLAGKPFGAITLFSNTTRDFDEQDETFLLSLASHAVNAIENSRLFAAQQAEREQAEAAATIARAALESSSAAEAGGRILLEIERVLRVSGLVLAQIDRQSDTLRYIAVTGVASGLAGLCVPLALSVSRGQFENGRPAVIRNFRERAQGFYRDRVPDCGGVVVPLNAKGRLIGTIGAADHDDGPLPQRTIDALVRLAPTIALALDSQLLGESERRQRVREQMLASALATLAEPVFILDDGARIRYANAAAEREYGYSAEEFGEMSLDQLYSHAEVARQDEGASGREMDGRPREGEVAHRRKDGSVFPAQLSQTVIRNEHDAPVGYVVRSSDLTEAKLAEDQRRQTEKMAALGSLVAGVAHELNNPLTGISAFAQLLLEEAMTDDQRDSVRLIKREADRAVGVIRDLLVFSHKTGEQRALVHLPASVDLVLRLRAHALRASGVDVIRDFEDPFPAVHADDARLQQVLLNLVVNAEHAMEESPVRRLTIRMRHVSPIVILEVSDTGAGMSPGVQEHIFEPFYTTKPAGSGTGLGLSVSYGIIQSHRGTLAVQSAPGEGTTFRITLPVAAPTTGSHA